MPSKDDLSEQLNLTTKLAAQVERMATAAEKLEGVYTQQVATLTQLANALGSLNVQGAVQNIQTLNQTLKETQQKMNDTGKASETAFTKLAKKVGEAGKTFKDKFPTSVAVATGALSGFYQGLQNTVAIGKGVAGFFESFISGAGSLTASILAIPLKIFEGLVDMAASGAGGSNELMQALENLRKEFGRFTDPTNKAILETTKTMKGFSDTGLSTWRVFGNMADRMKLMQELASGMGRSFNLLEDDMNKAGGAVLAYQKGLGLSAEEMGAVTKRAYAMGKDPLDVFKDLTKYSTSMGKALHQDAKILSREVGDAMKDIEHFGNTDVKVLTESAAYMHKFGLETKDATSLLDTFSNLDDATQAASQLQQAGLANIDTMKLMKLSAKGDIGGMTRELQDGFKRMGTDFEHLDNFQKKIIMNATHMTPEMMQQTLSLKGQSQSLKDVKKAGDAAQKTTLTQTEAMQKLADAIERMVQSGGGMKDSFWDMFVKGIPNGIFSSKEFVGIIFKIKAALRQVYLIGVQLGKALVEIVPGFKDIGRGLNEFFNPEHFTKLFKGISESVQRFFSNDAKYASQKGNIPMLVKNLQKVIKDFFTVQGPHAKQILSGFEKFFKFAATFAAEALKFAAKAVAEGMHTIAAMIRGEMPVPGMKGAGGAGAAAMGFLKDILTPLGAALKEAWKVLAPALKDLAHTLWDKFVEFIKQPEVMAVVKKGLMIAAALIFGPALTRAFLGAITSFLIKSVGGGLSAIITKIFPSLFKEVGKAGEAAQKAQGSGGGIGGLTDATKGANGLMNEEKKGNWGVKDAVKLGLKLIAIATAISGGGVEMAAAIWAMKKIMGELTVEDIIPQLLVLGAMVVVAVPLMLSLKIAAKIGSIGDVLKGGLVIAAAVGIVGLVGARLAKVMKKAANPAELAAAGTLLLKMSLVFLAMIPLIVASMAIGALASGPQAILLAAAAVGMVVIGAAVAQMATISVGIIKILAGLPIDADFQTKVDAFLSVMKAIQAFTDSMVKVMGMMMPSITDLLTHTSFKDKVKKSQQFMAELIGSSGGGKGIIGVIELVKGTIDQIQMGGPEFAAAAQTFANIMTAVTEVTKALTPPPEFIEAQTSFINIVNPFIGMNIGPSVSKYMSGMTDNLMVLMPAIRDMITQLSSTPIPDVEAAQAVAGLISSLASLMKTLTPDPKSIEAMNDSSAQVSYAWGLFKAKGNSDTGKKLSDIMSGQAAAATEVIKAVTSGPIQSAINDAAGFSEDKVEGIKVISDLMSMISGIINSIGQNLKSTTTEKIDDKKAERVWTSVPDVTSILSKLGDVLSPSSGKGLFDVLKAVIRDVPTDKGFMKNLDVAKQLLSFVGEVPKLAETLKQINSGAKGGAIGPTDPLMSAFQSVVKFFQGLGSGADMKTLMSSVSSIGTLLAGKSGGNAITTSFDGLSKIFKAVNDTTTNFSAMSDNIVSAKKKIGKDALAPALDAVKAMIKQANDLNDALGNSDLNKIDIKAKLGQTAKALGLGNAASYTVNPSKNVVVTVNLSVTMDVGEVEKVMIQNSKSIIADRLDFGTYTNPGSKATESVRTQTSLPTKKSGGTSGQR